jgi:stage V sporulation protein SpoVS
VVSHRGGPPTVQQISSSEVVTWGAVGACTAVLATIAAAIVRLILHLDGIDLVVFGGVYIGVGLTVSRRGWRQLASFVAGIALIYGFVTVASLVLISRSSY